MMAFTGKRVWLVAMVGTTLAAGEAVASFVTFETGQVRPLALTPGGRILLSLNTPDSRLEIFDVAGGALTHRNSVPVGLEPVAVAARSDTEVWVANFLSDSVSIVDIGSTPPRVVRTLLVGDEPRDIVFAGPAGAGGKRRAFVTTARLGQNLPLPLELTTAGTPRALVWVFDAENLGTGLGGTPLTILELFGDTPRALAATPDGSTVYAAVFHSGNQTTIVTDSAVCDGGAAAPPCDIDGVHVPGGLPNGQAPGGVPPPNENKETIAAPEVGIIVKLNRATGVWEDELGRNWNNAVRFNLPDLDVFRIDALADPPRQTRSFAHVGTVLFNMIVDPANGNVYVSHTEARNEIRFEGHGHSSTTLRGHLHESHIAILDGNGVRSRHLNKHITALPHGYLTSPMPPRSSGPAWPRQSTWRSRVRAGSTSRPSARARSACTKGRSSRTTPSSPAPRVSSP